MSKKDSLQKTVDKVIDGLTFDTVGTDINRGISFVIYADPGIGKSTLARTLPAGETLIINSEGGVGAYLGSNHVVFNLKDDLSQLEKLYRTVKTNPVFKYVVIDNISEVEQWMLNTLTKGRKKDFVELKEYGDSAYKMREYIRLFRDLVYDGRIVVFNAWEVPLDIQVRAGEVQTKAFPKLGKKLAIELCGLVDVVGHLEVYPKTGERFIRFEGTPNISAKSQFKGLEKFETAEFMPIIEKIYDYNYKEDEVKEDV